MSDEQDSGNSRETGGKAKRKGTTWGDIFRRYLEKGYDHGYAAHMADEWENRHKK